MFFSKITILSLIQSGKIKINPFDEKYLDSLSYELHLGDSISTVQPKKDNEFNGMTPKNTDIISFEIPDEGYIINPQEFIIAKTREVISCASDIMGLFDGKASLAQIGLFTHISSTLIEANFNSSITCELYNSSKYPIRLFKGQKIGQIFFSKIN